MTFNSLQFFGFFVAVLLLYYRLGLRGQNRLMVLAGSVFYASFNWRFLGLLYLSTIVDYLVGRRLGVEQDQRSRKLLLATSFTVQLGILGVFKYYDFFATSLSQSARWLGLRPDLPLLHVLLPVGISFYTFQTLAYVVTVYRGQVQPEQDLITFAAFVAWFPQLVAGPIERPTTLLPQVRRRRERPDGPTAESALLLILRGLFKKVVIADGVAAYVNAAYGAPHAYGAGVLALATVGFAVQVYGDFSGYSDIARGVSRLLGVELRRNFEQPFLSRDMREFWQRWHTSLGWWFTEFVAVPLGGARRGPARAALNVLVVFSLIGLWHGPAWTFVLWGTYNGVLVALWRSRPMPPGRHPMKLRAADVPAIAATFGLFCVGAVLFRATSLHAAVVVFGRIVALRSGAPAPDGGALVPVMAFAVVLLDIAERRRRVDGIEATQTRARLGTIATRGEAVRESVVYGLRDVPAGLVVGVLALGVLLFSGGTPVPFIYFKF